jgi:minor extracellular serine protease Vpr
MNHRFRGARVRALLLALFVLALTALVGGAATSAAGATTTDVVVQLDGTPLGIVRANGGDVEAARASLQASQDAFLARAAAAGVEVSVLTTPFEAVGTAATTVPLRYFWALNGLAVRVPADTVDTLRAIPGVANVEPVREVRALLSTSVPYVGAPSVWQQHGIRGEGMNVADIDTGIVWDHPSFSTDPATPPGDLHPKVKKYYTFTAALPDGYGHGTHVGGIIAADSSLGHPVVNPATGYGVSLFDGVAPKANLFAYKVLSDAGSGSDAVVALGIDFAVRDGAQVLNLSLGGTADAPNSPSAVAVANAMAAGSLAVVAAGNTGPGYSTVGTPATRQEGLTVGSSTDPGDDQFYVNDRADAQRFALNMMANSPRPPTDDPIEAHYVYVGEGCSPADYATRELVRGRIALIKRGTCTFTVKKELAQANGAVAAIIFNNVAGNFSGTMTKSTIVVGALSDTDGQHLVSHTGSNGLSSHTLQFDPNFDARVGQISGFSSRGPTDDYRIKPEIVAPGDSVTSAVPQVASTLWEPSGYAEAGGTSMAAPHVAGAGALIRQKHPSWTTREVKAALMNTARPLVDPAGRPYSIMAQGAGLLDIPAAITTPALILEPSHSFQVVRTGGAKRTVKQTFVISDKSGSRSSWSLSWADGGTNLPASGWSVSIAKPDVNVPAGGTASFTLSLTIDGSVLPEGDYEGRVVATNGTKRLTVPIFARHNREPVETKTAPVLADPGGTNTTGTYTLSWTDPNSDKLGYRVQQASSHSVALSDNAEAGLAKWRTEPPPLGWAQSNLQAKSGSSSFASGNNDARNATLTTANAISVPESSEASISFWSYEDTEPEFDFGYVEASSDGGSTWVTLLRIDGQSDGWVQRHANVRGMSGNVLIRFRYTTDELISAPFFTGWFVDDIVISVAKWATIAETSRGKTSYKVENQPNGTYFHRVQGVYRDGGGPPSNVVDIIVRR